MAKKSNERVMYRGTIANQIINATERRYTFMDYTQLGLIALLFIAISPILIPLYLLGRLSDTVIDRLV